MRSRVLVDANILYSRCLTDWISLASIRGGMYTVLWTEDMLAEGNWHVANAAIAGRVDYLLAGREGVRAAEAARNASYESM